MGVKVKKEVAIEVEVVEDNDRFAPQVYTRELNVSVNGDTVIFGGIGLRTFVMTLTDFKLMSKEIIN